MDKLMDQLVEQLEESKNQNKRLNSECLQFKKIICVLNEMNVLFHPIINLCKCGVFEDNINHQLIDLRHILEELNSNEAIDEKNERINDFNDLDSNQIINRIISFSENTTKEFVKIQDIEEYENNETNNDNKKIFLKRRGRGRPPKNSRKKSYLMSKMISKSLTKPKRKLTQKNFTNSTNINTKFDKTKGKIVTEEGKEVFLSRTKRLRCQWPGCEAVFRDREDLENHNWRHTGEKAYSCDWPGCNKTYSSRCYLKKHHETHIDPNVFKCLHDSCQEAFVTSLELNQHFQKSHDGNKPFGCSWPGCPQQFAVKRNLKDHQIVHIDEKRFRCDWPGCEAAFKRKQQLDIHICEVHQSEGKLRCDWPGCESTFSSHNKLKIHKMRHTGEKPYKCQWPSCEWSFRQHNHLKTHMLKHSGEKPYHCESADCDRRFQTKQTMKFHYEKCHRMT